MLQAATWQHRLPNARIVVVALVMAASGCASTGQNAPRTDQETAAGAVGGVAGAAVGGIGGAAVGALYGLAVCGPFFIICSPVFAVAGGVAGAVKVGEVGAQAGVNSSRRASANKSPESASASAAPETAKERQERLKKLRMNQAELEDKSIGYQSILVTVPQFGELQLQAFPLNANDRRGKEPFVICLASWWKMGVPKEKTQTLSIDPKMIFLTMPNGSVIKPSGYAVEESCPYPEFSPSSTRALVFGEINFGEPLVWGLNPSIPWWFPDLVLLFDVVAPGAEEKFSLQLGPLAVDGAMQDVPTIEFAPHDGKISRFP